MSVFYKLSPLARETRFALFPLANDVEITAFGEDGRDATFKALAGDHLVLIEDGDGAWTPLDLHPSYLELEESYVPDDDQPA